ncbi:hypothetical protein [Methanobrevibacter millerae]|uniref:Adhesin-like protein n=1 Tax=Methanobrevibacter millerae TaxID=230361 RepID=A0A1G5WMV9_9EURY|nr:hypothetical protein [Methanobrevibacter millerae]SDA58867.1 hypothetical protein SAMN02910315_01478 [Methanobrevibacter millerae]
MKTVNKILLVLAVLLIIAAVIATYTIETESVEVLDEYTTILGKNSNGTVYKIVCGNNSSNDTAIVILGVHSLEGGIHNATNETIMNLTKADGLNRKYIVYFIKLNFEDSGQNTSDYNTNRHMGELLAHDYVVPDIDNYDPYIVVDVHEMEDYWEEQRYIGVLDNRSALEMEYAYRMSNYMDYPIFTINAGTSPEWVTMPISKDNHIVILFETAQKDNKTQKMETAGKLVEIIDNLPIY